MIEPTILEIREIFKNAMNLEVIDCKRFSTGLCHYVYDVKTNIGIFVLRIAEPDNVKLLKGATLWNAKLRPAGIPLPEIYYEDVDAKESKFHFYIMERLEGTDICNVYDELSYNEKEKIAAKIVKIQNKVSKLGRFEKFGELINDISDLKYNMWWEFLAEEMVIPTKERLIKNKIFDYSYIESVENLLKEHRKYFESVEPMAFLDDLQTKNIIIDKKHKFSGIVDVDNITIGDIVYNVALTKMGLLAEGSSTDYIDLLVEKYKFNEKQKRSLNIYTLLFCVNFMSEVGEKFNKCEIGIDCNKVELLKSIFEELL